MEQYSNWSYYPNDFTRFYMSLVGSHIVLHHLGIPFEEDGYDFMIYIEKFQGYCWVTTKNIIRLIRAFKDGKKNWDPEVIGKCSNSSYCPIEC